MCVDCVCLFLYFRLKDFEVCCLFLCNKLSQTFVRSENPTRYIMSNPWKYNELKLGNFHSREKINLLAIRNHKKMCVYVCKCS